MSELADLGLWGDGDEIWAIDAAFEAIGMEVPEEDASKWWTVGDVWESATSRKPELVSSQDGWNNFRKAISSETGVDWTLVGGGTRLIDGRGHNILSRLFVSLRQKLTGHG